jgi:hypothetical protein
LPLPIFESQIFQPVTYLLHQLRSPGPSEKRGTLNIAYMPLNNGNLFLHCAVSRTDLFVNEDMQTKGLLSFCSFSTWTYLYHIPSTPAEICHRVMHCIVTRYGRTVIKLHASLITAVDSWMTLVRWAFNLGCVAYSD